MEIFKLTLEIALNKKPIHCAGRLAHLINESYGINHNNSQYEQRNVLNDLLTGNYSSQNHGVDYTARYNSDFTQNYQKNTNKLHEQNFLSNQQTHSLSNEQNSNLIEKNFDNKEVQSNVHLFVHQFIDKRTNDVRNILYFRFILKLSELLNEKQKKALKEYQSIKKMSQNGNPCNSECNLFIGGHKSNKDIFSKIRPIPYIDNLDADIIIDMWSTFYYFNFFPNLEDIPKFVFNCSLEITDGVSSGKQIFHSTKSIEIEIAQMPFVKEVQYEDEQFINYIFFYSTSPSSIEKDIVLEEIILSFEKEGEHFKSNSTSLQIFLRNFYF